jgi:hypothetical protein
LRPRTQIPTLTSEPGVGRRPMPPGRDRPHPALAIFVCGVSGKGWCAHHASLLSRGCLPGVITPLMGGVMTPDGVITAGITDASQRHGWDIHAVCRRDGRAVGSATSSQHVRVGGPVTCRTTSAKTWRSGEAGRVMAQYPSADRCFPLQVASTFLLQPASGSWVSRLRPCPGSSRPRRPVLPRIQFIPAYQGNLMNVMVPARVRLGCTRASSGFPGSRGRGKDR